MAGTAPEVIAAPDLAPVTDEVFGKVKPKEIEIYPTDVEKILDQAHNAMFGANTTPDPIKFADDQAEFTNALGLESSREHTRIAKIWQDKCVQMADVIANERSLSEQKWDDPEFRVADLRVDVRDGDFWLRSHPNIALSSRGLSTLGAFVGVPEAYVSHLALVGENDLAELNINRMTLRRLEKPGAEELTCTARFLDTDDGTKLRCVASKSYGILNNIDALEILAEAIGEGNVLASHMFNDTDRVYGNFFPEDRMVTARGDSDYGVGIAFRNSECLQSRFSVQPFLFRAVCLNGCIWGRRDGVEVILEQRHVGKIDLTDLRKRVGIAVQAAMGKSAALLELLQMSRDAQIELPNACIAHLSRANELTKDQGKAWTGAFKVEPFETGFGIINALTRAAQMFDGEKRVQMEELAGDLIAPSLSLQKKDTVIERWDTISRVARRLQEDQPEVVKNYVLALF